MEQLFSQIVEGLKYTMPAAVTGFATYIFLKRFFVHEEKKQILLAKKDLKQYSLPLRLQAYERLAIFMERISPARLVNNIIPQDNDKKKYLLQLVYQIESEYEHNLSQQIYISNKCWDIISTSKNATIFFVRNIAEDENVKTAQDLQQNILSKAVESGVPTDVALEFIRNEVSEIL